MNDCIWNMLCISLLSQSLISESGIIALNNCLHSLNVPNDILIKIPMTKNNISKMRNNCSQIQQLETCKHHQIHLHITLHSSFFNIFQTLLKYHIIHWYNPPKTRYTNHINTHSVTHTKVQIGNEKHLYHDVINDLILQLLNPGISSCYKNISEYLDDSNKMDCLSLGHPFSAANEMYCWLFQENCPIHIGSFISLNVNQTVAMCITHFESGLFENFNDNFEELVSNNLDTTTITFEKHIIDPLTNTFSVGTKFQVRITGYLLSQYDSNPNEYVWVHKTFREPHSTLLCYEH